MELEGRNRWALRTDRSRLERTVPTKTVGLVPAGDPYLASRGRALLVPQPRYRAELWPRSVWPGALLVNGELVGIWRRQLDQVTVQAWRPLEREVKDADAKEVSGMPIESARKELRWSTSRPSASAVEKHLILKGPSMRVSPRVSSNAQLGKPPGQRRSRGMRQRCIHSDQLMIRRKDRYDRNVDPGETQNDGATLLFVASRAPDGPSSTASPPRWD